MYPYSSRPTARLRSRHISLCLSGTLASLALAALGGPALASAQAAISPCPSTMTSTPFAAWGDSSSYSLVPGGSFEAPPIGWTFSGAAGRVAGSDPFAITGVLGWWSLAIATGSSAQSPSTCVEATERTYRFVGRSIGAEATVRPDLVYETAAGSITIVGKKITLKSSWEPSPIMHTGALLVTAITGGSAHLGLRFTTLSGTADIDDVYIDPRMR